MGVQVPVGEIQIALRWSSAGDPEEMISTIGAVDVGSSAGLTDFANDVRLAASSTFTAAPNMLTGWVFEGVTVYESQAGGGFQVAESNIGIAGTASGGSPPNNCALLVRKRTALSGRRGQGRMYIPSAVLIESAVNNNGVIDPATRNAIQTNVTNFLLALEAIVGSGGVRLFHSNGSASTSITSLLVDGQIATQRQRMRR